MLPAQPHAGPGPALPTSHPAPALIWARLASRPSPAALPSLRGAWTLDVSRGVRVPPAEQRLTCQSLFLGPFREVPSGPL